MLAAVLAFPVSHGPIAAGQQQHPAEAHQALKSARLTADQRADKPVVVVTGELDLGKISLSDFGDVDANR